MNACLVVTTRCNLRCPDCMAGRSADDDMSISQVKRIARGSWKFHQISITGGEPTLWANLHEATHILKSTGTAEYVKVISNGYQAKAQDYGAADSIQISHYGAVNIRDILRLKRELGSRLRVNNVTHRRVEPAPEGEVECTSKHPTFYGYRVYPCAAAWRIAPECGVPNGAALAAIDPGWCRTCEHNRCAMPRAKTVIEIRVLDSVFHWAITLPHLGDVRRRYRRWLQKDVELYNGEPG